MNGKAMDGFPHFEQAIIFLFLGALGAFFIARFQYVDDFFDIEQVLEP